jgi:hypothetical protein
MCVVHPIGCSPLDELCEGDSSPSSFSPSHSGVHAVTIIGLLSKVDQDATLRTTPHELGSGRYCAYQSMVSRSPSDRL